MLAPSKERIRSSPRRSGMSATVRRWISSVIWSVPGRRVSATFEITSSIMNEYWVEWAKLLSAAWRVGAVLTPLNPGLTTEDASYQLADSTARLTVVDAASIAKIDRSVSLVEAVDELSTLGASNELPPAVP